MPVEVLHAIKEIQGTEDELASIKSYLDSGADKEAPLGKENSVLELNQGVAGSLCILIRNFPAS
jgi:hypothetical protein